MREQANHNRTDPAWLAQEMSEANLLAVLESTDDLIAARDREGRLVIFNRSFAALVPKLFGVAAAPGLRTLDYLPATGRQHWEDILARVLCGERHSEEFSWMVDGDLRHYELTLRPVYANGAIIGSAEFTRDVTARRQIETALRSETASLHALVENIDGSIWAIDSEYRLIVSNTIFDQAIIDIFGTPFAVGESVIARNSVGAANNEWRSYYDRALAGVRFSIEHPQPFVDPPRWKEYFFNPILAADGAVAGVTVFGRDITARKHNEQERLRLQEALTQAQDLEMVGQLANGVAHEFNNLLASISLATQMALPLSTEPGMSAYLTTIQSATRRAGELVQQLLTFAGRQHVTPTKLNLNATIVAMLPTLRQLMGAHIDLRWQPAADLWPVHLDATQVNQVLFSLCTNARDAITGIGAITITTSNLTVTTPLPTHERNLLPGNYVQLTVSDSGVGMDHDTLAHIFEPFFSTKPPGKGVGLGLSSIAGIVRQNRGAFQVHSSPGQGATFTIWWPCAIGEDALPAAAPVEPTPASATILVMESDADVLQMTTETLRHFGHTVLAAATPHAALQQARHHAGQLDLLLTEITTPTLPGQVLAAQIRALHPAIKVIYTFGYADDALIRSGAVGANTPYLRKPYSLPRLIAKIREALPST